MKVALLDQAVLAGVGNIHASESLFAARIDPRRRGGSLDGEEIRRLARAIAASLRRGIETQDGPTRRDLIYDLAGRNLETEEVIPADSVPAEVRAAVQRDVAGGTIVNAERVTRETVVLYEVGVRHGGKTRYLTYDPAGKRVE